MAFVSFVGSRACLCGVSSNCGVGTDGPGGNWINAFVCSVNVRRLPYDKWTFATSSRSVVVVLQFAYLLSVFNHHHGDMYGDSQGRTPRSRRTRVNVLYKSSIFRRHLTILFRAIPRSKDKLNGTFLLFLAVERHVPLTPSVMLFTDRMETHSVRYNSEIVRRLRTNWKLHYNSF